MKLKLHIGCSGWQYPEWKDSFYPNSLAKSKWFEFYSSQFNTVEINYSFYHTVSEKILQRWYEKAPPHFLYSIKASRNITHYKKFINTEQIIQNFYCVTEVLKEKLGAILFQVPASFTYSAEKAERIIHQLTNKKLNVIEFRHPSWWKENIQKLFSVNNITLCTVDAPNLISGLLRTKNTAYLRLHGHNVWYNGMYNLEQLRDWRDQIIEQKIKEAWVYFDNTADGSAYKNAIQLKKLFAELET